MLRHGELPVCVASQEQGALAGTCAVKLRLFAMAGIVAAVIINTASIPVGAETAGETEPVPATTIEDALARADAQRQSGNTDAAIATLIGALKVAPHDPRLVGEYGKLLVAKGQPRDAIVQLNWAIRLKPDDWKLLTARGVAHDQAGETEAARSDLKRALAMRPDEPIILFNLALSHIRTGDQGAAEALLLKAQEKDNSDPSIARELARVRAMKKPSLAAAVSRSAPLGATAFAVELQALAPAVPVPSPKLPAKTAPGSVPPGDVSAPPGIILRGPGGAKLYIQAGAFASKANAEKLAARLARFSAQISPMVRNGRTLYRVRLGPYENLARAHRALARVKAGGFRDIQIVAQQTCSAAGCSAN